MLYQPDLRRFHLVVTVDSTLCESLLEIGMHLYVKFNLIIALFFLGGCGGGNEEAKVGQVIFSAFGFKYIPDKHQISIFDKYLENNVVQLTRSKDLKCVVYAKAMLSESVDIFKMCDDDVSPKQITKSDGIKFDPVINNRGDVAYLSHTYSINESEVYFNSNKIDLPIGFYSKLIFANDKLIGHYARYYDDTDWLFVYDTKTKNILNHLLEVVPSGITYSENNKILIEGMLKFNGFSSVGVFDISKNSYEKLCYAPCAIHENNQIINLSELSNNQALEILAIQRLKNNDPLFSLSAINNNMGRLSWSVSYNLLALIRIHEKKLNILPHSDVFIKNIANNLLASARFDSDHPGWPTKKYSISRNTLLSLLVDDAMVLYPLLKAYNMGLIDRETGQKIVNLAEKIFEYHESDYEKSTSLYHFKKNIDFQFDGVWLPFNQQNVFGSALIQLYKATGNVKYKNRAFQLARAFKSEFQYLSDGRLIWHYWPKLFYDGWSEMDNISINTPKKVASTDILFEDHSHATLNIAFINEFNQFFPNEIFKTSDIEGLRMTLQSIRYANGYSRHMSGDVIYQSSSWNFLPEYSWLTLGDSILKTQLSNGAVLNRPYFDGSLLLAYAFALSY